MTDITELAQLRAELSNPAVGSKDHLRKLALSLVEALEKAQRANGYLREQSAEWERKAISNFEECAEMSARIDELERQNSVLADGVIRAEQWLLESRTVKLPQRHSMLLREDFNEDYHTEMAYKADEVQASLDAADIKWEAE